MDFLLESITQLIRQNFTRIEIAIPTYFVAGVLSGLLPCMLPVIPITAGFLRNRQKMQKAGRLAAIQAPSIYCLGIVLCYMILGSLVVLTSSSFNNLVRNPYFLILLGIFFILLALSSIDLFSFQRTFSKIAILQNQLDKLFQKASQLNSPKIGTLLMGLLAGLLVSACASPVLVSMFLFLTKGSAISMAPLWQKTFLGATYSAFYGLGISLPLFITGILSLRIPAQGKWSRFIRFSLATLIFMVGLYEISNGIQILYRKKQGVVIKQVTDKTEQVGELSFYRNFYYGLSVAAKESKPIFIDFYGDWCTNCKAFDQILKTNTDLKEALKQIVLVKIYDTDNQFVAFQSNPDFAELKISLPLYAILQPDGSLFWKTVDYQNTQEMIKIIRELIDS